MEAKTLGDWGEGVAAAHLERSGWSILSRKFRAGRKEIDLVAQRGEVVAFVEVKTRRGTGTGHPLEAITRRKQFDVAEVASSWIRRFGDADFTYRFDAVAVSRGAGAVRLQHLEDAWRL